MPLISPLKQLITYDKSTFVNLTIAHLKRPLEVEIRKIGDPKDAKGQSLLFVVLNNHIKAIVDLKELANNPGAAQGNRRSFNEKNGVIVYE